MIGYLHDGPTGTWVCTCEECSREAAGRSFDFIVKMTSGDRYFAHGTMVVKINQFVRANKDDLDYFFIDRWGKPDDILEIFVPVDLHSKTSPDMPLLPVHPMEQGVDKAMNYLIRKVLS